jgi:hypothetical protein
MRAPILKAKNNNLSSEQLKTFEKFRRKLYKKVPDYRLTWVHPVKENIIEVGLEPPKKMTYRKNLQAAELAFEVENETGVLVILR